MWPPSPPPSPLTSSLPSHRFGFGLVLLATLAPGLCRGSATAAAAPEPRIAGTILGAGPARVVVEDRSGAQFTVVAGDPFGACTLTRVERDSVTLDCAGRTRVLTLEGGTPLLTGLPAADGSPPVVELPGVDFRALLADRQRLVSELSLVPSIGPDGRVSGYAVDQVKPGSLFEQAGLRDGDLITAVNGVPTSQPEAFMEMIRQLRDQPEFAVQIERAEGGQEWTVRLR